MRSLINRFQYGYNQQDLRSSETVSNGLPISGFQEELTTYNYNNLNQLLDSDNPTRNFTYDDDGNLTQGYTPEGYVFTAAYDAEDRLKSIEYVGAGSVTFKTEYLYRWDGILAIEKKYENSRNLRAVSSWFLIQ